jgi:hypothetical protein
MMTEYLNVTLEPVIQYYPPGAVDWGNEKNGQFSGVLGLIQNGSVDTACLMYQRTDIRQQYFDFAYSIISVSWFDLVKYDDFSKWSISK